MKIIDILNKIARGEEVPNKIMFKDKEYEYFGDYYWCDGEGGLLDNNWLPTILNDEVVILETTITYKQDTIKKVDEPYESVIFNTEYDNATKLEKKIIDNIELIRKKQDEIIDHINKEV